MKKIMLLAATLSMLLVAALPAFAQENSNVCEVPVTVTNTGDAINIQDAEQTSDQNAQPPTAVDTDNDGLLDSLIDDLDIADLDPTQQIDLLNAVGDLLAQQQDQPDQQAGDTSQDSAQDIAQDGSASIELNPVVTTDCVQSVDQNAYAYGYGA